MIVASLRTIAIVAVLAACGGSVQPAVAAPAPKHAAAVCDDATGPVFDDWEEASLAGRTDDAAAIADRLHGLLRECVESESARLPRGWTPATLRADDVPAALAIARARAVEIALAPMAGIAQLPALRELLERCAALRPGYADASAELLLGTFAANLSVFTHGPDGGDWFAKAHALAGDGVLMVGVLRARSLGVAHGDKQRFEAELAQIAGADLARWPEHRRANELAVRKARRYLAYEARLFR